MEESGSKFIKIRILVTRRAPKMDFFKVGKCLVEKGFKNSIYNGKFPIKEAKKRRRCV